MIFFVTNHLTPRLEYVVSFLFSNVYDVDIQFIQPEEYDSAQSGIIFYGVEVPVPIPSQFVFVPRHQIMLEKEIKKQNITIIQDMKSGFPYFFEGEHKNDQKWPFDIFSMIFYLLSRYEEYLPHDKDEYGRYKASQSLAYRNQFLDIPLIDFWLQNFVSSFDWLKKECVKKNQTFAINPTIDIDSVWAFAFKGVRQWKGVIKDIFLGRFRNLKFRWESHHQPNLDPFFSFNYLENLFLDSGQHPLFFILYAKNPNEKDINHNRHHKEFNDWLVDFSQKHTVGIHPSFQSHQSLDDLVEEKTALEKRLGKKISMSRQHYILLNLPESYRRLISAGIQQDYSMGYPEKIGYRASTGYSFFWYDLEKEETTKLKIFPFQVMDVTLKKYMGYSPTSAIHKIKDMISLSKEVNSPIRLIWHNSSFFHGFGWKNWEKVLEFMLKEDNKKDNIS
ncbi:MAG: polysaccharide deacetylase family protein [Saprospiraceae bacterium]